MAIRLVYLVMGSTILTLTTTPNQLTDGLEKSLGFLKKVGVCLLYTSYDDSVMKITVPFLSGEAAEINVGCLLYTSAQRVTSQGGLADYERCIFKTVGRAA